MTVRRGSSRARVLAQAVAISLLTCAPTLGHAEKLVFREDFSSMPYGPWQQPPSAGYRLRGEMFTEYPVQRDGLVGAVLTTRGLFQGERVVFPAWIDGQHASLRYDVDFQRMQAIIDTAVQWHVNVDATTGLQRFYQAALLHGAKPGVAAALKVQLVEESAAEPRGFRVTTLGHAQAPTLTQEGWHHLQIRSTGTSFDEFVVSLDGNDLLAVQDATLRAGYVGVRVGLDTTRWDNIRVVTNP